MQSRFFLPFIIFLFSTQTIFSQNLRKQVDSLLKTKKADVGIAVYHLQTKDTITWGNHRKYPMQSVYKFHLALGRNDETHPYTGLCLQKLIPRCPLGFYCTK